MLQREGATTDLTELCLAKALRVGGVVRRERSRGLAASSVFPPSETQPWAVVRSFDQSLGRLQT